VEVPDSMQVDMEACTKVAEVIAGAMTLAEWDQEVDVAQHAAQEVLVAAQVTIPRVFCRMLVLGATTNRKPHTGM